MRRADGATANGQVNLSILSSAEVVRLENVTVARAGKAVLRAVNFSARPGARIFIGGENGAGKSSLLALLAGKLYPFNNEGRRSYAWDSENENFRQARRHIAFVGREEQNRLQAIHATSTVAEFLAGHLEGEDFLYRESLPADATRVNEVVQEFGLAHLAGRTLRTLSLGEMRLALVARMGLHTRRLYLFDEVFSSLSPVVAERIAVWIQRLPATAAVILTGHDDERMTQFVYTDRYIVKEGKIQRAEPLRFAAEVNPPAAQKQSPPKGEILVEAETADFYHDFQRIFEGLSFHVFAGDRILLTGANGSGKSTLLRILHGDFYPAWGKGYLRFTGSLRHERKVELWNKVQMIAASHFTYYPRRMTVGEVLASRYSGSIYEYPGTLPAMAQPVIDAFAVHSFQQRLFSELSEGEKTRVLFARAFLEPAPVYLIDEGFIALSARSFEAVVGYLNRLPGESVVVIAANERIALLKDRLAFDIKEWQLADGRLAPPHGLPANSL